MKHREFNIIDWERKSDFYPETEIAVSIKSFDLSAIRKRYLAAKSNASGKGGSVERRAVSYGGVARLKITKGVLENLKVIDQLKEPRGLSSGDDRIAFSLENRVIIIDQEGVHSFSDPWFSYIHTVAFHPYEKDIVLVSSSGFDALFEYHYPSGKKVWEWFAWEHGLNKAHGSDGEDIYLSRKAVEQLKLEREGKKVLLIEDPLKDHLPTAQRAAFINTASYDSEGNVLATLFHEGSVRKINRESGLSQVVLQGLKNPHGGFLISEGRIMATNTGKGQLWIAEEEEIQMYIGKELPGRAPEMLGADWWQNAVAWNELYLVIDSNRNALLVLDPEKKYYDLLPYDANWAVQDLIILGGAEPSFEGALKEFRQ